MNTASTAKDIQSERQDYYDQLKPHSLSPLWEVLHGLVTPEPKGAAVPMHWSYAPVRELLMRAGELITADEAERRVLIYENPGMPGSSAVTTSLYAGLQLILPGEIAPAHRHSQSAMRFIMEGDGAYTAVDGERAYMAPFDLILTPNWYWHDHGNETDTPTIWVDGLDIPILQHFNASFAERYPDKTFPASQPPGDTQHRYGKNLRPVRGTRGSTNEGPHPMFHYPFRQWRESLAAMSEADTPDPHMGYKLEFINPRNGGPIMATMSAFCQLVPKGLTTQEYRSTDGAVYVVAEGQGTVKVGEETYKLEPRDVFAVPSWQPLSFEAGDDLVMFNFSDRSAQEKLMLWRELKA